MVYLKDLRSTTNHAGAIWTASLLSWTNSNDVDARWNVNQSYPSCPLFWGFLYFAGGKVSETPPGIRVRVSGLNHDVMEDDIKELFAGVGDLLHCEVKSQENAFDDSPLPTIG